MSASVTILRPRASARRAGLHYVSDEAPGITRIRAGRGFAYRHPSGSRVRDRRTLERIRVLAIPPAWTQVWICPSDTGHIQATGRDARGRKQYRYHPSWTAVRDEAKYGRLLEFGRALPGIRRRVRADLRQRPLSRPRVLATVVELLAATHIRVGNEEYARDNGSFGLTTMRDRHVEVRGAKLRFRFRAKSGILQRVELTDPRLAASVKKCQDLPGQTLFQYLDEEGSRQQVSSTDVNAYLREIAERDFTAKDFRTWAGTVQALAALQAMTPEEAVTARKKQVVAAIDLVAGRLGNTRAVCRRCYVHPAVLAAYMDGGLGAAMAAPRPVTRAPTRAGLTSDERAVIRLLQREARSLARPSGLRRAS